MTIYVQASAPVGVDGDQWFDEDDSYRLYNYSSGWIDTGITFSSADGTGDINRQAMLDKITKELCEEAMFPEAAQHGPVYTKALTPQEDPNGADDQDYYGNLDTGQTWTVGVDAARIGDGRLFLQDFISLNYDIKDNDITDTIVSTALRCTQVRRARYAQIYAESEDEGSALFHLDIAAQQWYEEFNQLGRKYKIESGRDVIESGVLGAGVYTGEDDLDPSNIEGALELCARVLEWHRSNAPVIDIRTCHGDCHGNCHGNRSRR